MFESGKVGRVTRIQACRVGVRSRGDQQVQDARSRLASHCGDGGSKLAIAGRDFIVDGQSVKSSLEVEQSAQALGTD